MSRMKNSMRNIAYAMLGQFIGLIISFVSRTIFIKYLGAEYLGVHGLFSNILSILSLAELGIGTAIIYALYKPLAENDTVKIRALMKLFKKAYILIGLIVLSLGLLLTPFLEHIIAKDTNIEYLSILFLIYTLNSATSYFFSYKRSLIIADQKQYITTIFHYSSVILLNTSQIIFLIFTQSYLLFLLLQLFFTLITNIGISITADKMFPYIKGKNYERLDVQTKQSIKNNIKALLMHRIGGVVVTSTDSILISSFEGIVSVGIYSNYLLITSTINTIIGHLFSSITSSVGNLGAKEDKKVVHQMYLNINFVGAWVYGFASISLIILLNPFIKYWLGGDYLFPLLLVSTIVINFYLGGMRNATLTFRNALGLFWYDRYKAIIEALINLVVSMVLVQKIGITGIFIGTTVSTLLTSFWVEPYILFKYGFNLSVKSYFLRYLIYTIVTIFTGLLTYYICSLVSIDGFLDVVLKSFICLIIINSVYIMVYFRTKEFRYFINVLKNVLKIKQHY